MSFWDRHGNVVAGVIVLLLTALFVGGYVGAPKGGPNNIGWKSESLGLRPKRTPFDARKPWPAEVTARRWRRLLALTRLV